MNFLGHTKTLVCNNMYLAAILSVYLIKDLVWWMRFQSPTVFILKKTAITIVPSLWVKRNVLQQQQNLELRIGTSKMHLSPPMAWAAVRSKAVVLFLLTFC